MPLSEREQRLLEQMERALYAEDPRFANVLSKAGTRSVNGRGLFLGIFIVIVGMAGLLAGVALAVPLLGVLGFVSMLGGVLLGISAYRAVKTGDEPVAQVAGTVVASPNPKGHQGASRSKGHQGASPTFMGKFEERWRKRRETDGH